MAAGKDAKAYVDVLVEVFKSIGELKSELKWIATQIEDARREAKEHGELLNFQDAAKN